jgi:hypothetical protein
MKKPNNKAMSNSKVSTCELSELITSQLQTAVEEYTTGVVKELSDKYKFDYREAILSVGLDKVEVTRVSVKPRRKPMGTKGSSAVPLPYCGKINEECCHGIRLNHGLMTQCGMLRNANEEYCKTCDIQSRKNSNGLPTNGNITMRGDEGWRTPGGKQPVAYGNVMEKLGITQEAAMRAAQCAGVTISEDQFIKRAAQRGRPSKKVGASTSDTESEDDPKKKKKRGRPKKDKKVVNGSSGDDLIANLMAQANVLPVSDAVKEVDKLFDEKVAHVADVTKDAEKKRTPKKLGVVLSEQKLAPKKMGVVLSEQKLADVPELVVSPVNDDSSVDEEASVVVPEQNLADMPELVSSPVNDESSVDEEGSVGVTKFEFEGKTYLKDVENSIYDLLTQDHIGDFDEINNCIDYCDDEDEE